MVINSNKNVLFFNPLKIIFVILTSNYYNLKELTLILNDSAQATIEKKMMVYFEYTDKTYGTITMGSYNDMKSDCYIETIPYLPSMALEIIYYHPLSNLIIFELIHSNDDITTIIDKIDIKTMS